MRIQKSLMKLTFFLFILISNSFRLIAQENNITGIVVVYYSKKIPKTMINPPDMYCLDSVRLVSGDTIYPLKCEYLSNEKFAFVPINTISNKINVEIRNSSLYCENPLENYIHKGGEIFIRENDIDRLYISFNITGKMYRVIPNDNSVDKGDSLTTLIDYQKKSIFESDNEEICNKTINYSEYLILQNDFISSKLTESQKEIFGFCDSGINKFYRYECW